MILSCNFEEVSALHRGATSYLADTEGASHGGILAPPVAREAVHFLAPRIEGDLSFATLHEQMETERGIEAIVGHLHDEMVEAIHEEHPAAELAVAAYFDYAHTLAVLGRLRALGREMRSILEVVTGGTPGAGTVQSFHFPD